MSHRIAPQNHQLASGVIGKENCAWKRFSFPDLNAVLLHVRVAKDSSKHCVVGLPRDWTALEQQSDGRSLDT
jgi:hypothetical protein